MCWRDRVRAKQQCEWQSVRLPECFLTQLGIDVASRVIQIGPIVDETPMPQSMLGLNDILDQNPVRCLDSLASEKMVQYIDDIKNPETQLVGTFEVYAEGFLLHWEVTANGIVDLKVSWDRLFKYECI